MRSPQPFSIDHGTEEAISYNPPVMMVQGSNELVDFSMAFLTSTWYITNPYLKSKLITVRRNIITRNSGMAIDEVVACTGSRCWGQAESRTTWCPERCLEQPPFSLEAPNDELDAILRRCVSQSQDSSTDILIDDDPPEVEKTGTHTQFYDKFSAYGHKFALPYVNVLLYKAVRHEIAEIMQAVWHDPTHRAVMMNFTS